MAAPIPRLAPVTIATLPVSASRMARDHSGGVPSRRFRDRLRRGVRRRGSRVVLDVGADLDDRDAAKVRALITRLLQRHDTATERGDVAAVADAYHGLTDQGQVRFFAML